MKKIGAKLIKICRNFKEGRNHLTENGEVTLCRIPLTNPAFPPVEAEIIPEETCKICLGAYQDGFTNPHRLFTNKRFQAYYLRG